MIGQGKLCRFRILNCSTFEYIHFGQDLQNKSALSTMGPSHWLIGKLCIFVDGMVTAFTIDKPKLKKGHTLYSGYADNLHGPSLNMRLQHILWIFSENLCAKSI